MHSSSQIPPPPTHLPPRPSPADGGSLINRMTSATAVVTASLEAELSEAQRRLHSGRTSILESTTMLSSGVQKGSGASSANSPDRNFVESFEAEFGRAADAIRAAEHSIESAARATLLSADALARTYEGDATGRNGNNTREERSSDVEMNGSIAELRVRAKSLADRVLQLHNRTLSDAQELRRMAHLADTKLGTSCGATTERRLESDPWTVVRSGGGIVVVLLSDINTIIRDLEEKQQQMSKSSKSKKKPTDSAKDPNEPNDKWVPPSAFERMTTKYWVRDQDLTQVLLASVAELPLLVFGRRGGRILDQRDARSRRQSDGNLAQPVGGAGSSSSSNTSLWTSLASSISSVYFDSPDMRMYTERLKRNEGAQLFRIRWYGSTKPRGDEPVYLELKTHHEKWIGETSVKERVALRERDVAEFLDLTGNQSWDTERASALVRVANPNEDQDSTDSLTELLLKMRALICKFNLTPCVRTSYTRVALQSSSTNKLRLTIDRDVTVINERARDSDASTSWCLEDNGTIPHEAVVKMPYCIFEVKVAGSDVSPDFVSELERSRAIIEAKKFSKFLSACSIFNVRQVKTLPWWATDAAFAPLYDTNKVRSSTALETSTMPLVTPLADLPPRRSSSTRDTSRSNSPAFGSTSAPAAKKLVEIPFGEEEEVKSSGRVRKRLSRISRRMSLPSRMSKHQQKGAALTLPNQIAPRAPARVEPKSYFANERTFIQWISAALLFVTISQLLYILAAQNDLDEARIAGSWMLCTSLFIAIYALCVYYRRIHLMKHRKPYGYIDFFGPGVLTISIILGVVLFIVYSYKAQHSTSAVFSSSSASTMANQSGQCVRRGLVGLPIMEQQPSGIVVDETRGLALVPSLNRILALPDGLPSDEDADRQVQVVATLLGTNIEALEYVDGNLYALSEEIGYSELIQLQWENEDIESEDAGNENSRSRLVEVSRWSINLQGAEGMALLPSGDEGAAPKLVVAGQLAGALSIDVFDIESFQSGAGLIDKSSKMNKDLVSRGLEKGKVGSMQYFEGLLYILFDNDRVIRAFDTNTGKMVQETVLPVAELGSERDWEGMRLQRIPEEGNGHLRGSSPPSGTLVLHLALDTPAQVWSLALNEDGRDGNRWTLPRCAG